MSRRHVLVISALLGAVVVAGASAALKTVPLGPAQGIRHIPDAVIAVRSAKLDRLAVSLRRARNARTPALPPIPHFAPVRIPTAPPPTPEVVAAAPARSAASAPAAPVKYVQPPPVVRYEQPATPTAPASTSAWHEDDHGDDDQPQYDDSGVSGDD